MSHHPDLDQSDDTEMRALVTALFSDAPEIVEIEPQDPPQSNHVAREGSHSGGMRTDKMRAIDFTQELFSF